MIQNETAPDLGSEVAGSADPLGTPALIRNSTPSQFDLIPAELKAYPQFVCWKYGPVRSDGARPKPPYDPKTGQLADVSNPSTWGTYVDAREAFIAGGYDGIGFVLTEADPYAFIDLDNNTNDPAVHKRNVDVILAFDSYTEVSPSGTGFHIIVLGKVPSGRKRDGIEIYSQLRYMTLTGAIYHAPTHC